MGTNKISVWSSLFFILTNWVLPFPFWIASSCVSADISSYFFFASSRTNFEKEGGGATFVSRLSLYPPAQMPFRLVTQSSRKIACRVQSRSAYEGYDHIENLKISFKLFDILRFPSVWRKSSSFQFDRNISPHIILGRFKDTKCTTYKFFSLPIFSIIYHSFLSILNVFK